MIPASVHAYLRASVSAGRDTERVGPFLASFSRRSPNPFLNYAIPDDGAVPRAGDVAALRDAYARRGLRARLEYLPVASPAVEPVLLAAGFEVEGRLVLMEPGTEAPALPPPGIDLVVPDTVEACLALRRVQFAAYGEPGDPTVADAQALLGSLTSGGGALLALTVDGLAVGAGEFTAIVAGVSEITSIGVVPAFRRRGIAAGLCARLVRDVRAAGAASPFLMANEAESKVYRRVGFEPVGEVLHIAIPA